MLTEKKLLKLLKKNPSSLTEKEQQEVLSVYPTHIAKIRNPYQTAQLLVVTNHPVLIAYIDNPCELAQLNVVNQDYRNLKYIKNPCDKAVRTAKFYKKLEEINIAMKAHAENMGVAI